MWQLGHLVVSNHLPNGCGVHQYSAFLTLSQHLVQVGLVDIQSVSPHPFCIECWRLVHAYGWKLCAVADEHQPAGASTIDVGNKVIEQVAAPELGVVGHLPLLLGEGLGVVGGIGNHGRLVDQEEGVGMQIVVEVEVAHQRPLAIDFAMDGEGWVPAVLFKNLSRASRRCKEHHFLPQFDQRLNDGRSQRGFSCAGRAT